jgi:hypothetical protein
MKGLPITCADGWIAIGMRLQGLAWAWTRAPSQGLDQYFLTILLNHIQAPVNTVKHFKALNSSVLSRVNKNSSIVRYFTVADPERS